MGQTMVRLSIITLLFGLFTLPVQAQRLLISDLIEQAQTLNDTPVVVEGEAILEALERGDHTWINLNDGSGALGVWVSRELALTVKTYGDYDTRGDLLRVEGVFHRACDEHGGDMDIHVTALSIVKAGQPIPHPVDVWRFTAAIILGLCALFTLVIHRQLLLGWLDKSRPSVNE